MQVKLCHFCCTITFLWQVVLDHPLRLLHIFITGDVQLEDFQITGALPHQALGPGSFWRQTPSKDHKPLLVQTPSQLVSKAAVTACYQHSVAGPVLHRAAAMAGNQLGNNKQQDSRDRGDADDLADE